MTKVLAVSVMFFFTTNAASAAEVLVNLTGVRSHEGNIGCLLFNQEDGFPKAVEKAFDKQVHPAMNNAICQFTGLSAGAYAVAANHDANANQKLDTNLLGIPKEAWGVSNNIRKSLRAPTFEEAQFKLQAGQRLTIEIEVKK